MVNSAQPGVVKWTASEYIDHRQGFGWFSLLVIATLVLGAVVYLITKDYFAVAVIAALGLVVGVFAARTPDKLDYELSVDGVKIGEKFHPLNSFKSFSIIQEGPIVSINFSPIRRFMPPLSIFFDPGDEQKILDVLGDSLPHEQRSMDRIESLSRRLRF